MQKIQVEGTWCGGGCNKAVGAVRGGAGKEWETIYEKEH
ncbi:hypothetical protein A2U01_0081909, partial [Trifolium medium]|nr:hypothetical protein [Trifolium medium]